MPTRVRNGIACLLLAALLACSQGENGPANQAGSPETGGPMFDHVILLVSDLKAFQPEFEARSGIELTYGGAHPDLGTANLLASLGEGMYLEILGPDPSLAEPTALGTMLIAFTEPQLAWFAIASSDLAATASAVAAAGMTAAGPNEGSRTTPEGIDLHWQGLIVTGHGHGDLIPFFIDWLDTPHPSATSAQGLSARSLIAYHPDIAALQRAYELLGVRVPVIERAVAGYELVIDSPNGPLTYQSDIEEAFFLPLMSPAGEKK